MKCDICRGNVEEIFLHKIRGTYVKVNGKKKVVCQSCQREYKDKLIEKLRPL